MAVHGLVVGTYLAVLLMAVQLMPGNAPAAPAERAAPPGAALATSLVADLASLESARITPAETESPLVTLAIAGFALGAGAVWRLSHRTRRPRPAAAQVVAAAMRAGPDRTLTIAR